MTKYETTDNKPSEQQYLDSKLYLNTLIDERTEGAILRSKSQWYEQGEKSSKYFLNLEKKNSINNTVKKLVITNSDNEISDQKDILNNIHNFYEDLFKRKSEKTLENCNAFLNGINVPKISPDHKKFV